MLIFKATVISSKVMWHFWFIQMRMELEKEPIFFGMDKNASVKWTVRKRVNKQEKIFCVK